MYLTRSQRFIFWLAAVPLLLFAALALLSFLEDRPSEKSTKIAVLVVIVALTACPVVPLLAYYFSGASRKRYQRDILKDNLHIQSVAELRGVQWTLLAIPDHLAAPAVAVITLFLQNAHDTPRVVTVGLLNNPFQRGGTQSIRQQLEGGEVGALRFALLVSPSARAARHEIRISIEVRRAGKVGARVIPRDGINPRRLALSRRTEIEVLGGHSGPTLNEAALGWPAFQRIFITGQAEPDLEPVRLLESL
ncbi:MAG TPA: hypothetical protein VK661_13275 [Planctomycetota bacterium]|nr:hypothetical protein [Planctomycetota bacterium]